MPIITLEGPPRSGKSHYAVKYRLLDFIKKKIVTVTNVDGLQPEAIAKYLGLKLEEVEPYILHFSMSEMQKLSDEQKLLFDPDRCPNAILQPGFHLLVDEAWSLWPAEKHLTETESTFFPYHGHYKDDRGVVTEITLATQDIGQLSKKIKPLIQERIVFEKMTKLGLSNKFQYKIFSGNSRRYHFDKIENYDPKIFPLYASTSGGGNFTLNKSGKSVFSSPLFKFILPAFLLASFFLVPKVFDIMSGGFGAKASVDKQLEKSGKKPLTADASSPNPQAGLAQSAPPPQKPPESDWRLVGIYRKNGVDVALLTDNAGRFRSAFVTSKAVSISNDIKVSVDFENLKSSPYTGSVPTIFSGTK